MAAFDYVILLMSFVFALALTHLLSRVGALVLARDRVRLSGLQTLTVLNAVVLVYLNWLTFWDARTVKTWDLLSVSIVFAFAIGIYFVCVAAAPETANEGEIDLEAFYWRNRRPFWAFVTLLMLLALAVNFVFLKSQSPELFLETNIATLPFFAPGALALSVRARWAQWVGGAGLLILSIGWLVIFNADLV
jgi:hypothetical protein